MSNKNSLRFLVVILSAAFATAALVLTDVGALAQNSNSNTTDSSAQNDNANANAGMMTAPRRGRRRGRRRAATTTVSGLPGEIEVIAPAGQAEETPRDLSGEQVDLSGTYTGRVTMTGGHEMSGEGTLTITGNTFTLAVESMTHNGRVYAVVTRGYIGASFYFPDITDPATNTPVVAPVRARRSGNRFTLTPAPGVRTRLTFNGRSS
ncbi:MAG TPA: hypothetical protein VF588_06735 [Pyrinomonadaceae bacterium]